jgi:hypothetical protein
MKQGLQNGHPQQEYRTSNLAVEELIGGRAKIVEGLAVRLG